MSKRMLADVLWEAANRWLATGPTDFDAAPLEFSCNAAIAAEARGKAVREAIYEVHQGKRASKVVPFLEELGCDSGHGQPWLWQQFPAARIQGVRYMWLLLAMHVAADEGITV